MKQQDQVQQHSNEVHTQTIHQAEAAQLFALHFKPERIVVLVWVVLGVLFALLSEKLTVGPSWIPLVLLTLLLLPLIISFIISRPLAARTRRVLIFCLLAVATLALLTSITLLIESLAARTQVGQAKSLLRDAALLWVANVLVFALWYWELDGGGPLQRVKAKVHGEKRSVDLLFPQLTMDEHSGWLPRFVDYVFVSFTTATAFSPTDTMPLTHWAKALMMIEAILSMLIVLTLAARAINIL